MVPDGKIPESEQALSFLKSVGQKFYLLKQPLLEPKIFVEKKEKGKKKDEAPFPVKASPFEKNFTLAPVV